MVVCAVLLIVMMRMQVSIQDRLKCVIVLMIIVMAVLMRTMYALDAQILTVIISSMKGDYAVLLIVMMLMLQ